VYNCSRKISAVQLSEGLLPWILLGKLCPGSSCRRSVATSAPSILFVLGNGVFDYAVKEVLEKCQFTARIARPCPWPIRTSQDTRIGEPFWRMSIPRSPIDLSWRASEIDRSWKAVLSKSMPNNRPMASFATTTVFEEDRTSKGIGRYCSAVRDANAVVGGGICIERESEL
jgi:hypothetical protein